MCWRHAGLARRRLTSGGRAQPELHPPVGRRAYRRRAGRDEQPVALLPGRVHKVAARNLEPAPGEPVRRFGREELTLGERTDDGLRVLGQRRRVGVAEPDAAGGRFEIVDPLLARQALNPRGHLPDAQDVLFRVNRLTACLAHHLPGNDSTMRVLATLVIAFLVAGCSDDSPVTEAPATAPRATEQSEAPSARDAGPTGTIEARVTFKGAPVVETIKINKDVEQCGTETTIETIRVGDDQGLAYVVVSIAGLEGKPTARTPTLDQRGCQFQPHVVAMQPGEIEILNSDGILHNIHTYSEKNPSINKAQPRFKKVMTETFTEPEIIKVTCDVHSWMRGWIAVLPHPYFGVTDTRGTTRIEAVPAGRHTVEAWHETLGRRTQDVTVKAGETVQVAIEFPPPDKS